MFNLKKKVALVAGGMGLIGSAVADALRKQGAYTSTIDLKEGADFVFDISDRSLWNTLFDNMERCDVFVNMAYPAGVIPHMEAFFVSSKVIAEWMKSTGSGVIINCSSIYGVVGSNPHLYDGTNMDLPAGYAFNKAGIMGLTRWLATNYGRYGIRANCICPGGVFDNQDRHFVERYKKQVPLGKMVSLKSIAQTVIYLACCKDVTGQSEIVDGGYCIR